MTIDIFTSAGQKKGTLELPVELFGQPINQGLIHQALVRQQSNRRNAIAHAKNRHEVAGSTRKIIQQKHTGNARRGSIRSPLLRGGGKAFGPRNEANFVKDMPRSMRRTALVSSLSYQAKQGSIVGLESYPDTIKTKALVELLGKMKMEDLRKILFVLPEKHHALHMSCRNLRSVKTVLVGYINPEDIVGSRKIIFVGDAIKKAVEIFAKKTEKTKAKAAAADAAPKKEVSKRSKTAKKTPSTVAGKTPKVSKKKSSASSK
jgi:large subunit ribosomal protein L4